MKIDYVPLHTIADEIAPNVAEHYSEVLDKDNYGEPNIDWDYYITASLAGHMLAAIIRDNGRIVAYSVYCIGKNPRYKHKTQASNEAIYIDKEHRGNGIRFISDVHKYLKNLGVSEILYAWSNDRLAKILEKAGCSSQMKIWSVSYE